MLKRMPLVHLYKGIKTSGTRSVLIVVSCAMLAGCTAVADPLEDFEELTPTTILDAPAVTRTDEYTSEQVERGKYMVELLGCGSCHTDGALVGTPDPDRGLAGSRIGIAYSNPMVDKHPGVVFPSNLSSDPETGLGNWTDDQIIQMIRSGVDRHGRYKLSVMPWPAYAKIVDEDSMAIVAYLRGLPPIKHRVPASVVPGEKTTHAYVHFGVYRSRNSPQP